MEIKFTVEPSDFDALDAFVQQSRYRGWLGLKGRSGPGSAMLGRTSLASSPESLRVTAPSGVSEIPWSGIRGYTQTADHIFVMLDGVAGQIIPKRGQSAESLAAFVGEIQRYAEPQGDPVSPIGRGLKWWVMWVILVAVILLVWHFARIGK
jgi:hypothetical protein